MLEKLDFMMRFWDLMARHEALGAPLSPVERIELLSLIGLMATDDPLPPPGPPPRSEHALEAQITARGSFVGVEVRMVCAGGVVVACLSPLPAGESTVVRLADDVSGMDYAVPCVVEWGIEGSPLGDGVSASTAPPGPDALRRARGARLGVRRSAWAGPPSVSAG